MIRFIDLFAGIGGIRLAFEQHNAKCVFSSEIDEKASQTYAMNFNDYPAGDITKIYEADIPRFDILTAGFPCQPFSVAGYRKGFEDTRGTLFFEIARILKFHQPKAFLLENVAGLVSHDKGRTIQIIEETLEQLNYQFAWKLMNAKDYGIPQNRNRWYCVGFRKDLEIGFNDLAQNDYQFDKFNFPRQVSLQKTLENMLDTEVSEEYNITVIAKQNISYFLQDFITSKRHNPNNIVIANDIRASRCRFRSDGISPCLTAKMGTGGNNIPVYVDKHRKLTERECLRLMGFPDTFDIPKNSFHSYKQIGNSVVVPVVALLAKEIIRLLE